MGTGIDSARLHLEQRQIKESAVGLYVMVRERWRFLGFGPIRGFATGFLRRLKVLANRGLGDAVARVAFASVETGFDRWICYCDLTAGLRLCEGLDLRLFLTVFAESLPETRLHLLFLSCRSPFLDSAMGSKFRRCVTLESLVCWAMIKTAVPFSASRTLLAFFCLVYQRMISKLLRVMAVEACVTKVTAAIRGAYLYLPSSVSERLTWTQHRQIP